MAKLQQRPDVHEMPDHVRETPTEIPPSREVEEHHRRVTAEPTPAAKDVRWLRWLPVVLLIAAGMVVFGIVISRDETATNPGPNADLPEVWTMEWPALGPIAGPNADLPEVWTMEWPALAPIAGPNADLPEVWTMERPVDRGPNADLPEVWTMERPVDRGPNADLPEVWTMGS